MSSSQHGSSTRAILYAFLANLGIAIAKTAAAVYTSSGSMLAEAIHSFADCGNQVLLYIGLKQAEKPADDKHPLGYGKITYFWSFIVAIMLFSMGGLFSIYEGWHKLHTPEPITQTWIALVVLGISIVLESFSLLGALREIRQVRGDKPLLNWLRHTSNAELVVVHDATQHDAPDKGLQVERGAGEKKDQQHAHRGERDRSHYDDRIAQGFILRGEHHIDQDQCEAERDQQFPERFLLLLEISGDPQIIARGSRDLVETGLDIARHRAQIAPGHIGFDCHQALLVLPVYQDGATAVGGFDQIAQGDLLAGWRVKRKVENLVQGSPLRILELHENPVGVASNPVIARFRARHRRLDHRGHIAHAQPQIGDLCPIDADVQLGNTRLAADIDVGDARHIDDRLLGLARERP